MRYWSLLLIFISTIGSIPLPKRKRSRSRRSRSGGIGSSQGGSRSGSVSSHDSSSSRADRSDSLPHSPNSFDRKEPDRSVDHERPSNQGSFHQGGSGGFSEGSTSNGISTGGFTEPPKVSDRFSKEKQEEYDRNRRYDDMDYVFGVGPSTGLAIAMMNEHYYNQKPPQHETSDPELSTVPQDHLHKPKAPRDDEDLPDAPPKAKSTNSKIGDEENEQKTQSSDKDTTKSNQSKNKSNKKEKSSESQTDSSKTSRPLSLGSEQDLSILKKAAKDPKEQETIQEFEESSSSSSSSTSYGFLSKAEMSEPTTIMVKTNPDSKTFTGYIPKTSEPVTLQPKPPILQLSAMESMGIVISKAVPRDGGDPMIAVEYFQTRLSKSEYEKSGLLELQKLDKNGYSLESMAPSAFAVKNQQIRLVGFGSVKKERDLDKMQKMFKEMMSNLEKE